jgi:hypothetical protein
VVTWINESGDTALHIAAWHGHLDACRKLLEAGAHRRAKNKAGVMPEDYAKLMVHSNVVEFLQHGQLLPKTKIGAGGADQQCEAMSNEATQVSKQNCPLRDRALRIFVMADKGEDARLDIMTLVHGDSSCQRRVHRVFGTATATTFTQTEWLDKVKQAAHTDHDGVISLLDMFQSYICEQKDHWPLREQALEVFHIGDRNGNGELNMDELTEMRGSSSFAQAMVGNIDVDKSGTVSRGEWLAYIKRLANENETSAGEVLKLYRKQFASELDGQGSTQKVVKETSALESTTRKEKGSSWWACC